MFIESTSESFKPVIYPKPVSRHVRGTLGCFELNANVRMLTCSFAIFYIALHYITCHLADAFIQSEFNQEYKRRTTRIQKVTFLQESQTTKVP